MIASARRMIVTAIGTIATARGMIVTVRGMIATARGRIVTARGRIIADCLQKPEQKFYQAEQYNGSHNSMLFQKPEQYDNIIHSNTLGTTVGYIVTF